MIRWLVSLWRGPLCDAGTGHGARPGCLKTAVHTTLVHPAGWSRGFRWCEEHKDAAGQAVFGAWGAVRSTPAPTDAQVLDADAELAALVRRAEVAEAEVAAGTESYRKKCEEGQRIGQQRDAALAQLAEWRESVVAANRISQAFEGRALKAEAELAEERAAHADFAATACLQTRKLAAVEELVALWDRQLEEYPATSEGRFAAAAVKLCGEELRVRLRPPKVQPHPHPGLVDLGLESDTEEPTT